jgi:hypothetical protein
VRVQELDELVAGLRAEHAAEVGELQRRIADSNTVVWFCECVSLV